MEHISTETIAHSWQTNATNNDCTKQASRHNNRPVTWQNLTQFEPGICSDVTLQRLTCTDKCHRALRLQRWLMNVNCLQRAVKGSLNTSAVPEGRFLLLNANDSSFATRKFKPPSTPPSRATPFFYCKLFLNIPDRASSVITAALQRYWIRATANSAAFDPHSLLRTQNPHKNSILVKPRKNRLTAALTTTCAEPETDNIVALSFSVT